MGLIRSIARAGRKVRRKKAGDTPEKRGIVGENTIGNTIRTYHERYDSYYKLIHDFTFYTGKVSHQIDFVLVNKDGVFVIEVKNWEGIIRGNDTDPKWARIKTIKRKSYTYYFDNPIIQNKKHATQLRRIFDNPIPVYSLVVIASNNCPSNITSAVVNERGVGSYFHYIVTENRFTKEQIDEAYNQLVSINNNLSNYQHVQNIKQTQTMVKSGVCPICGGQLVLRTGKDGKHFYGCSSYPKCKFTKKM